METTKKGIMQTLNSAKSDLVGHLLEEGWTYIKTVVDVDIMKGPIIILDKDQRVISVNKSFYKLFQVDSKETENRFLYELGNKQWNIPALRRLLEDILPEDTFFKGFEVTKNFPIIGEKTIILSARPIYLKEKEGQESFPPMIFLSMEDVTEMMIIAEALALQSNILEKKILYNTQKLESHIKKLEKEINSIKNKK